MCVYVYIYSMPNHFYNRKSSNTNIYRLLYLLCVLLSLTHRLTSGLFLYILKHPSFISLQHEYTLLQLSVFLFVVSTSVVLTL